MKESVVWYGMLGGFAFYLAKRVNVSIETNHRVLGCHQDVFPSIQLDPETELIKDHGRVFLDMDGSSMVWQLGYVILIYLLSPIRSSQFLTNYIDFLCI